MAPPPEVVFAKKLAGAEKYERDQGVRRLTKWLKIRSMGDNSFTDEEMLRVWKGLFYCYWMSDKMLIQEELAENISNIIDVFGNKKATLSYIKCFMITMGREWYGLDKWRKDKYLQLIRRFVRKIFKYNKAKNWDKNIARDLAKHFRTKCFTTPNIANGIGFQLQVIDVYMEELAKVGGEEVSQEIIEIYLEPAFKVIWKGQDFRLVEAAKVRIFEYLMRQSDCGIRFEAEKEARHIINHSKEKVVDIIKEEDLEKDEGIDLDVCDKMEADNFVNVEAPAEDPRGGNVSVEIPQLQLDYNRLADKCFEHGSGIKTSESARTILYTLSKQFKDVANDEFPLSGELDEEMKARLEAAKIPIDTDESAKKLLKIKMRVEANLKEEAEAKKIFKERMKKEREAQKEKDKELAKYYDNYEEEQDGEGGSEDKESDYDQENSLKRKSEDQEESEEESPEAKKARIERRKEMQRKHKREQQRRKRERKLAEELAKQEELRLSQVDIDRDIDIQSVLTQEKPKEKKKVKKEKVASPKVNITKDSPESDEKVAKKKKNKKVEQQETNSLAIKVQEKSEEEQNLLKKKKKKEKKDKKAALEIVKPVFNDSVVESPVPKKKKDKKAAVELEPVKPTLNESTDASSVTKKKKKDKKAAVEPEPVKPILNKSVDESSVPKKKKKKEKTDKLEPEPQKPTALQTEPQSEGSVKKKKDKKKKRESVAGDEKIAENVQSEKKKDKKEKKVNVDTTGGAKLFAESDDWDTPAPEEKQDPVGFKDFAAPTLTTPGKNTHTAMFLKKALSKSNTPKKKLSQIEKLKTKGSSSESKAKRVNWALTKNMSTSERELLLSIKSSPGIPHDPRKKPEKGLLKTKTMPRTPQNENPVQLNTQLNSISKKGLKMAMKFERMAAKDFFF